MSVRAPERGERKEAARQGRRRPRHPVRWALGLGAVALLATGVLDTAVASAAQSRIAARAGCVLGADGKVTASLDDPLAGLRVLTGSVGTATVSAQGVERGGVTSQVTATVHGLGTDGAYRAGSATATVGYQQLGARIADQGTAAPTMSGDGSMLDAATTVGGLGIPVTIRSTVTTQGQQLTVTPTDAVILGRTVPVSSLPKSIAADRLAPRTVPLPQLPPGVTLTGATPDADGLHLRFALAGHPAGQAYGSPAPAGRSCAGTAA